jgi:hypothetical protein
MSIGSGGFQFSAKRRTARVRVFCPAPAGLSEWALTHCLHLHHNINNGFIGKAIVG